MKKKAKELKTTEILEKTMKMHRIKKKAFSLTSIKCLKLMLKHMLITVFIK